MENVYIYALGCTENLLDAQRYHEFLLQNDYHITEQIEEADTILFVTCGVTSYIANECEAKLLEFKDKAKEGVRIIICGCLPYIEKERVEKFNTLTFKSSHGDVIQLANILGLDAYNWDESMAGHEFYRGPGNYTGEDNKQGAQGAQGAVATASGRLKKLVNLESKLAPVFEELGIEASVYHRRISEEIYKDAYFVHVARGCGGNCSYCAVKFVKGDIKSKEITKVEEEVMQGISQGKKEIILAGDDVGSYGKDIGVDFSDLMRVLNKIEGVTFTIRNFEPFWMVHHLKEMEEILSKGKVASVVVPLQSGSNKILNKMRRNYQVEQVMGAVKHLKEKFPKVLFSTHILVGFPGETEEDMLETLRVLQSGKFDFIRYAMYTDRPNTESSKMEDKVPVKVKYQRMRQVEEWVMRFSMEKEKEAVLENWLPLLKEKIGEIFL